MSKGAALGRDDLGFLLAKTMQRWNELLVERFDAAGYGERFGHGLGHGVGLEVHEDPRLSQRSEDVLAAGNALTVEPGVYLPGRLGVRIEDLVVVTGDGREILSSVGKELTVVE